MNKSIGIRKYRNEQMDRKNTHAYRACVIVQKSAYFLSVMPDSIRHPAVQPPEETLDSGSSPE